ncbi:hypothetical protein BH10ACT3_BH10ACT3_10340 [soil metagenome]
MNPLPASELSRRERWRYLVLGLLRALAATTALVVVYFVAPLDNLAEVPIVVSLVGALAVLITVSVLQVRAIMRSDLPGLRAVEVLAITVPLFVLLFAADYFVLSRSDASNFSEPLTRLDSLYFTITVFSTVGFGDITSTGQTSRALVTVQMLLDLLVLGLGIKLITGAIQHSRRNDGRTADPTGESGPTGTTPSVPPDSVDF